MAIDCKQEQKMKGWKRVAVVGVLLGFAGMASAVPEERVVTVESWQLYIRSGVDYNFEVRFTDSLQTSCAAANQNKVFTNWYSSNANVEMYAAWQAALQYASATDTATGPNRAKVSIKFDPAVCDATRGALLLGIRNYPVPEN